MNKTTVAQVLQSAQAESGFRAEDLVSSLVSLFYEVADRHAEGFVGKLRSLEGLDVVAPSTLMLVEGSLLPTRHRQLIEKLEAARSRSFDVLSETRATVHVGDPTDVPVSDVVGLDRRSLEVITSTDTPTRPCFVVGFVAWEQLVGHHDELSDIHVLGMLLASLALGRNFFDVDDVELFATHRRNLFVLHPDVHPVIARLIVEMTEVERGKRLQDLRSAADRLKAYRDQPVDFDLDAVAGSNTAPKARRAAIQEALRDRLFEINRRNRMVYFKPSQQSVNLTVGSVPVLLDVRNLSPEHIVTWTPPFSSSVLSGRPISLNSVLRFDDSPYLAPVLDKVMSQERRDRAEYGMGQLRLVICFLHWHNLKEAPTERISTPLLLLPVTVTKKRGVADSYVLQSSDTVAEVNPALRHHFRQLYGIALPESVDLDETDLRKLHADIARQIESSAPGVTLRFVEKPELAIIHQTARIRVDQYRRRQHATTRRDPFVESFPHSYRKNDLRPLGIQLFNAYVRKRSAPNLRSVVGAPPIPRTPTLEPVTTDSVFATERRGYSLVDGSAQNPYVWDFDLCSVTLSNFNYRKMTLVRDYAQLIERNEASDSFDRIFSLDAKPVDTEPARGIGITDGHLVVDADETQRAAIARSRDGRSYIIQGPPGTGKSQTITNLIADYVARGKRVLFVCEKRAALDVVHARLRSHGLDELCAVIHDSQEDKRSFIQGMRSTYEQWIARPDDFDVIEQKRLSLAARFDGLSRQLTRLDAAVASFPPGSDLNLRRVYERLCQLRAVEVSALALDEFTSQPDVPSVASWRAGEPDVRRLSDALSRIGASRVLAHHPISVVNPQLLHDVRPADRVETVMRSISSRIDAVTETLTDTVRPAAASPLHPDQLVGHDLVSLGALLDAAAGLSIEMWPAFDSSSSARLELNQLATAFTAARDQQARTRAAASGWTTMLSSVDSRTALDVAKANESSLFKVFNGRWRSVKKTVQQSYNFSAHRVTPSVTSVLEALVAVHGADDQAQRLATAAADRFATSDLLSDGAQLITTDSIAAASAIELRRWLITQPAQADVHRLRDSLRAASESVDEGLSELTRSLPLPELRQQAVAMLGAVGTVNDLVTDLRRIEQGPADVAEAVRMLPVEPDALERMIFQASVRAFEETNLDVARVTALDIETAIVDLNAALSELRAVNAEAIRSRVRSAFLRHVAISETSASQLQSDDKDFKKKFTAARRELEHEFGKTMRYRSIRDVASNAPSPLVMDLRPVWLMSPLSVSDTLPLDPSWFDVVIFDEASQIPLEEAIPSLYRAHQAIIVGDRMQLPPTQFFSTGSVTDDETLDVESDDGDSFSIILDGDSFLSQSASALPSTMLAWHYRSRSEDLIGFSNAAFYGGALATIPERARAVAGRPPAHGVDALLERPISFHYLPGAVYENRQNTTEAQYVAQLVRTLLMTEVGLTVGVAAFSEAQQTAIEDELERLSKLEPEFGQRLDEEERREIDGQFVGLFVKNLENLQGDERDIIIMSVCYGPGPTGRMLMNFGPINQRGGEKRLNVIFSRSKQHMAIVSSVKGDAITNDHNDGARALRQFLEFAEAHSLGDTKGAALVLDQVNPLRRGPDFPLSQSAAVDEMARSLTEAGYDVDVSVGSSRFRCDVAVRRRGARNHAVAVLVDTELRAQTDAVERAVTHTQVLQRAGWRVVHVTVRHWWEQPDAVIKRIEAALNTTDS